MPKMKTHRGAAKRFRMTPTGKVMHRKGTGNHFLVKKSGSRRRRIEGMAEVGPEAGNLRQLLGGARGKARRPGKRSPAPSATKES
jgi:large subunit ribosomal protein L35